MVPAGHHGGFIHRMNGPLSAPWWAFQELGHTQGLLCTFFIACALCIWELFAMAKILQDPVFSRLCTSCRVEILGRKRKKKKVLDCFSSANCSLRQVIVVKNIHKYSDSSLTKYQDIGIYSSVSSPKLVCLFQTPLHQQMFSVSQKFKVKPRGSQGSKE